MPSWSGLVVQVPSCSVRELKAGLHLAVLSSMLLALGEDWLILDRVIEAPARQVTLAWDGMEPGSLRKTMSSLCQHKVKHL